MFGMIIDAGPKFYVVRSPTPYMTLRSRSRTKNFCIAIFYNFSFYSQSRQWILFIYGVTIELLTFYTVPSPSQYMALRSGSQILNFLC